MMYSNYLVQFGKQALHLCLNSIEIAEECSLFEILTLHQLYINSVVRVIYMHKWQTCRYFDKWCLWHIFL